MKTHNHTNVKIAGNFYCSKKGSSRSIDYGNKNDPKCTSEIINTN